MTAERESQARPITGESAVGAAVGAVALAIVGGIIALYVSGLDIQLPGISPALAADSWALIALFGLAAGSLGGMLGAILGDLGSHVQVDWTFPRAAPLKGAAWGLLLGALGGLAGAGLATGVGLLSGREVGLDWRNAGSLLLGAHVLAGEGASQGQAWAGIGVFVAATAWWGAGLGLALACCRRRLSRAEAAALALGAALVTAAVDYFAVLSWLQPGLVQSEPFWALALPRLAGALVFVAFPPVGDREGREEAPA